MDKKTCMILLVGFIFVIVFTNNNSLEGITNIGLRMQNQIDPVKYTLNSRNEKLSENPGFKTNNKVLSNYDKTNDNIADIGKHYPKLKDTTNFITEVNNANIIEIIKENNRLENKQYKTNNHLKNIDVSLEKVNNSEMVMSQYSYDTVLWAIIALGLFITSITMIM
jgi:hypothetical protein